MKKYILILLGILLLLKMDAQQWGLYTLYAPKSSNKAYLIDTLDNPTTFKTWTFETSKKTAYSTYMIYGDTIVRSYSINNSVFNGGGTSGGVQKVDWNNNVIWDYQHSSTTYCLHHDICPMPNGNVLMISYELKTAAQLTQAGSSTSLTTGIWSEKLIEVQPTGPTTGIVVWEWHLWDHLCQNNNATKDNYVTSIPDNKHLMNLNYKTTKDWWHMNGIDYNEELDLIAISSHNMNEVYIIDHSTTTAQAAGHSGGRCGKGGDFLYRWGNPAAYGLTGTTNFNVVHDAHFVPSDNPNYPSYFCAYNNKGGTGSKTAVDIWQVPFDTNNCPILNQSVTSTPTTYNYRYTSNFSANNEGNSQQLPNGNMIVNNPMGGVIYEVNSAGTVLWSTNKSTSHAYRFEKCFVRGPQLSVSASNYEICQGNSLTINASASSITETTPNHQFNWSNGINNANSITVNPNQNTTYTVTVTNSAGCTAQKEINITVKPKPMVNAGNDIMINSNDQAPLNVSVNNGSGNYQYQWQPSAFVTNPTSASTTSVALNENKMFIIFVTDLNSGCQSSDTLWVNIASGNSMIVNLIANPNSVCSGNNVQLTAYPAGGNQNYTFNWSSNPSGFTSDISNPTHIPTETTTYYVTVTDGTLSTSSSITVNVYINPNVPNIQQTGNVLSTDNYTTYQWYKDDNIINNATTQNYSPTSEGYYSVIVSNEHGCTATSAVTYYTPSNISKNNITSFAVYPNPTKDKLYIQTTLSDNYEVSIYNKWGDIVFNGINTKNINVQHLPSGLYLVRVSNNSEITTHKIIINR